MCIHLSMTDLILSSSTSSPISSLSHQSTMKRMTEPLSPIHILFILYVFLLVGVESVTQELLRGFSATPDSSISSFQSLLNDPTGVFSLGFLRIERSELALVILHVPSSESVWVANITSSASWSKHTSLFFNGSLVLTNSHKTVVWLTESDGDRFLLLNNSNLQIQKAGSVLWQSFDFPSDTLLENQNFTVSMSLFSLNGIYSMRLGENYVGLYSKVNLETNKMYWKHTAMEAKAAIVEGEGPIYAQVSSNGFLGMYQNKKAPVDVLPFDSFQKPISGIRRLRLESDGNLRGYYWDGSIWNSDFHAISDDCELPHSCGSYGLCRAGKGCSCLDDRKKYQSGECFPSTSGNFCSKSEETKDGYWVLRRRGVELPFKELMGFEKMGSLEECESSCEKNCKCWGSVFNNASGFCYRIDFPINTLVGVGDESKFGYFKVRNFSEKHELTVAVGVGLTVAAVLILVGVVGFGVYSIWRRKRRQDRFMEDGLSPGAYKDLSSSSFGSVELSKH